jgi:archaellum biogenesis ATPase FlaH
MHKVQKQMAGGIPLGVIVNLGSASGTGKSTIADECTYYWIFNSPHKIGVLSLESDAGQYGTKVLSRHVGRKIDLIETPEEKLEYLNSDYVLQKEEELWKLPDGTDRWHLIEDRDGGLESIKELIMELIVSCGCKVIIIDPLQDLMDGLSVDDQAVFQRWMKGLLKSHAVTFVNINHTRKTPQGGKQGSTGADLHEEDFLGSSSIFKSAACNLLFTRNKEAEDEIERNTTYMKMTKCRWTGNTGMSGQYYYDNPTHTLWDKDDYMQAHPQTF